MFRSLAIAGAALAADAAVPAEQIHIAYTGVKGQLSVDFVSTSAKGAAELSLDNATWKSPVQTTSFSYPEVGYMHQALLNFTGVTAGQQVYYRVGGSGGWTQGFAVTPIVNRPEVHAVFGDFGYANDVCMDQLIKDAEAGVYDSVLHVGDWAYNFEDKTSSIGNDFMNDIQGYAAIKPVMPAAGNHEACGSCAAVPQDPYSAGNFSQYRARMHSVSLYAGANSGSNNNIYYSFNQGLVHYIVFSAEAYAYKSGPEFIANQLAFMKADLAAVDRTVTPWVVGLVHKDWTMEAEAYADFAPVLENAGVDLLFCGHVHYYNRYMPYDSVTKATDKASVSADGHTYTNPKYMVTIVTGASGDHEDDSKCDATATAPPSIECTQNYGYGLFSATDANTATWTFKTVKQDGPSPADYTDTLTISQASHGPRKVAAASHLRKGGKAY